MKLPDPENMNGYADQFPGEDYPHDFSPSATSMLKKAPDPQQPTTPQQQMPTQAECSAMRRFWKLSAGQKFVDMPVTNDDFSRLLDGYERAMALVEEVADLRSNAEFVLTARALVAEAQWKGAQQS